MRATLLTILVMIAAVLCGTGQEKAVVGPATEKRFPPLQVPKGFKATLFACDPMVEYPSVIAVGPRPGTLFVAADFMTGLGHEIIRRDEIRLIDDSDGDGYADKMTVFATGFNSIQGLAYHAGSVYVMHAPYLSVLRDKDGKGEERRELLQGLGLAPEEDQIRLHNANGVVVGHDGWLYLALGDRGCKVTRPEGDKLILEGGGILRCRPDGRDLHVFATGLRNIYDVALDEDLNVFIRDNENDGGMYKNRLCHSFFGADHGYPYAYLDRPDEALAPLADLGLGSSAGGVCYLENNFPEEYRGNLFFCQWGRAVMRSQPKRQGSSFAPLKEVDFAVGASNDPYGFKPTDLVVGRDGELYVSDWADGQRPKRGRGRIYRIAHTDSAAKVEKVPTTVNELLARLEAPSYHARVEAQDALRQLGDKGWRAVADALDQKKLGVLGRMHAVWVLTRAEQPLALAKVYPLALQDPEPRVQVQALRALVDGMDPVLKEHRLVIKEDIARNPKDDHTRFARVIALLTKASDPRVQREAFLALGRLSWYEVPLLAKNVNNPDPALAHAVQWAMRRSENWSALLGVLDEPSSPLRDLARRAVAEQDEKALVVGLMQRLRQEPMAARQLEYADLLMRVHRKPAAWTYWGFRPGPRPINTVAWDLTRDIELALDDAVADLGRPLPLEILRLMVKHQVPARTGTLVQRLATSTRADEVAMLLTALEARPADETLPHLAKLVQNKERPLANRLQAATQYLKNFKGQDEQLLTMAKMLDDDVVLVEILGAFGSRQTLSAAPFLTSKLTSPVSLVRAAALTALAESKAPGVEANVTKLLDDKEPEVRTAAVRAAGNLILKAASDRLLKLAGDPNVEVRRASFTALGQLGDPRATALAITALDDRAVVLSALGYLGVVGGPTHAKVVTELARREPSLEIVTALAKVLADWHGRAQDPSAKLALENHIGEVHGHGGLIVAWQLLADAPEKTAALVKDLDTLPGKHPWKLALSTGLEARIRLAAAKNTAWVGVSEVTVSEPREVEFFSASTGLETIWLNGKIAFQREKPGVIGPYPDRFPARLKKGRNQIVLRLTGVKTVPEFQLRFRRLTASPEHERLAKAALSRAGNPEHGRAIFMNAEKSQCIKCHRVGDQGERIGPELTGLGNRFSKVYIIESILEPSRTIAPSFETIGVVLNNGKVMQGVKAVETETSLTLVDIQAQKHLILRKDIESQARHPVSTMPDGIERRLSEDEFVDLISFLVNLKTP